MIKLNIDLLRISSYFNIKRNISIESILMFRYLMCKKKINNMGGQKIYLYGLKRSIFFVKR